MIDYTLNEKGRRRFAELARQIDLEERELNRADRAKRPAIPRWVWPVAIVLNVAVVWGFHHATQAPQVCAVALDAGPIDPMSCEAIGDAQASFLEGW